MTRNALTLQSQDRLTWEMKILLKSLCACARMCRHLCACMSVCSHTYANILQELHMKDQSEEDESDESSWGRKALESNKPY